MSADELGLQVNTIDGVVVVRVVGEIDLYTAPKLRACLLDQVVTRGARVVVDLSRVTFIDSTGLSVLAVAHKQAESSRGQLIVRSPTQQAFKVLEITGLSRALTIEDPPTSESSDPLP